MKMLNGAELAGFVKERQARQVRGLRQAAGVKPKLAIVQCKPDPVIDKFVSLKKGYGADIEIEVDHHQVKQSEAEQLVNELNSDNSVHGIIIQLPLADTSETDHLLNKIDPKKDVDGLGEHARWDPATPMAINWLLAGYNVDLKEKNLLVVGQGRLVGSPLTQMWQDSGLKVTTVDEKSTDQLPKLVRAADVVVTATGVAGLITSGMLSPNTVVVDAGVASEGGKLVSDLADDVRERSDLTLTPTVGGVGPLTVTALFDNVIRAARLAAEESE